MIAWITVVQRMLLVRRQLRELAEARYFASSLTASKSEKRTGILSDAGSLEGSSRQGDCSPGIECQRCRRRHPRERVQRPVFPNRASSQSASKHEPGSAPARAAGTEERDPFGGVATRLDRERRHPRRARRWARRSRTEQSQRKEAHGRNERLEERRPRQGQGARRDHRRGELRELVLQGVEYSKDASRRTPSQGSCTSTSAGTTSRTSSSPLRSTSSRARSEWISPTQSGRTRTTPSSSRTSRRPASRSRAA